MIFFFFVSVSGDMYRTFFSEPIHSSIMKIKTISQIKSQILFIYIIFSISFILLFRAWIVRIVGCEQKKEEEQEKLNSSDSDEADGMIFPSQSVKRNLFAAYENLDDINDNDTKNKKMKMINDIDLNDEDFE